MNDTLPPGYRVSTHKCKERWAYSLDTPNAWSYGSDYRYHSTEAAEQAGIADAFACIAFDNQIATELADDLIALALEQDDPAWALDVIERHLSRN